jgi:hypothetical protein
VTDLTDLFCVECGRRVSLDTGYAEYEDGVLCLECDARALGWSDDGVGGPGMITALLYALLILALLEILIHHRPDKRDR